MKRLPLLAILLLAASHAEAQVEPRPYEISIDSSMSVKSPGLTKPQPMTARTTLAFRLEPKDGAEELTVASIRVTVNSDGKTLVDSKMARAGASFQKGEESPTRIPYDQATPALRKMLDLFDAPLARIRPGAEPEFLAPKDSTLVENGVVEQASLFHVPFPTDRSTWEVPTRFPMGNNQYAQGTLTYTKADSSASGPVQVNVAGDLRASGKLGLGEIKSGTYKITGKQTYDPAASSWTSGTLNVEIDLVMESGGHEAGNATGTMKISLSPAEPGSDAEPSPPASSPGTPPGAPADEADGV